jgi:biopolymer transport protein ExbD
MAKREIPEINAGSMADIAFLLLIFFLVTTTMDKDTGILRQMSIKFELPDDFVPPDVAKRNLMKIQANAQGQLMIRKDMAELSDVRGKVREFYTANMLDEVNPDMPRYEWVTSQSCNDSIAGIDRYLKALGSGMESIYDFKMAERKEWEKRLKVIATLGKSYREIALVAAVQIELQTRTEYELMISILNEVKAAINDLRDEKARELFGISYRTMVQQSTTNPAKELEYADWIEIIEILIPERIVELKPADKQ